MTTVLAPRLTDLNGVRKAAILTVLLGENASGELFKHLNEEEIEQIAREVALLGPVPAATATEVLEEFHTMWKAAEYVTKGGVDYAQKLLVKSLGPDLAKRVLDRVVKTFESSMTDEFLMPIVCDGCLHPYVITRDARAVVPTVRRPLPRARLVLV